MYTKRLSEVADSYRTLREWLTFDRMPDRICSNVYKLSLHFDWSQLIDHSDIARCDMNMNTNATCNIFLRDYRDEVQIEKVTIKMKFFCRQWKKSKVTSWMVELSSDEIQVHNRWMREKDKTSVYNQLLVDLLLLRLLYNIVTVVIDYDWERRRETLYPENDSFIIKVVLDISCSKCSVNVVYINDVDYTIND